MTILTDDRKLEVALAALLEIQKNRALGEDAIRAVVNGALNKMKPTFYDRIEEQLTRLDEAASDVAAGYAIRPDEIINHTALIRQTLMEMSVAEEMSKDYPDPPMDSDYELDLLRREKELLLAENDELKSTLSYEEEVSHQRCMRVLELQEEVTRLKAQWDSRATEELPKGWALMTVEERKTALEQLHSVQVHLATRESAFADYQAAAEHEIATLNKLLEEANVKVEAYERLRNTIANY